MYGERRSCLREQGLQCSSVMCQFCWWSIMGIFILSSKYNIFSCDYIHFQNAAAASHRPRRSHIPRTELISTTGQAFTVGTTFTHRHISRAFERLHMFWKFSLMEGYSFVEWNSLCAWLQSFPVPLHCKLSCVWVDVYTVRVKPILNDNTRASCSVRRWLRVFRRRRAWKIRGF